MLGRMRVFSVLLWLTAARALAQEGTVSPPASSEAPTQPRSETDARMELGLSRCPPQSGRQVRYAFWVVAVFT